MKQQPNAAVQNIAIVGAGLVGSLLSVYLGQRGYNVNVYERRADMRHTNIDGGRSINLALSRRGWQALQAAGLKEKVTPIAIPMYGREIHTIDGKQNFQAYGKNNQAIYSVSRGQLNKIMLEAADEHPNAHLHFNKKCTYVDVRHRKLSFTDTQTNQSIHTQPDLIFGADGAFSAVRSSMMRTSRFNYTQQYLGHGYKELHIPPGKGGTWQLKKNALHIWPRKSFMLIALPNTDGSFTCTLFLAYEGGTSFNALQTPDQVNLFFDTYFPTAKALMPKLVEDFFNNPTGNLITIYCNPWVYNNNVALIGDAAHAIVPFYGQGMNAGFEDCYVLNKILEQHTLQNGNISSWANVLSEYQEQRIPDGDAIANLALRNFTEMRDLVIDPSFLTRKEIEKEIQQKHPAYLPLYSMVTFSDMRYSQALAKGLKQDAMFEQILSHADPAKAYKNGEFDNLIQEFLHS